MKQRAARNRNRNIVTVVDQALGLGKTGGGIGRRVGVCGQFGFAGLDIGFADWRGGCGALIWGEANVFCFYEVFLLCCFGVCLFVGECLRAAGDAGGGDQVEGGVSGGAALFGTEGGAGVVGGDDAG